MVTDIFYLLLDAALWTWTDNGGQGVVHGLLAIIELDVFDFRGFRQMNYRAGISIKLSESLGHETAKTT